MTLYSIFDSTGTRAAVADNIATAGHAATIYGPGATIEITATDQLVWTEGVDGRGGDVIPLAVAIYDRARKNQNGKKI